MKIIVEVPNNEAKRIAEEATEHYTPRITNAGAAEDGRIPRDKKFSPKKAARIFAQNIIDRYFSVEYLDTDIFSE